MLSWYRRHGEEGAPPPPPPSLEGTAAAAAETIVAADVAASVRAIADKIKEAGNVTGVFAFSQGCAIAAECAKAGVFAEGISFMVLAGGLAVEVRRGCGTVLL